MDKIYEDLLESMMEKDKNQLFIDAMLNNDYKKVESLVEQGLDVNAKGKDGWTPLMWAAALGCGTVAVLLVYHGADVNARNNYGETSLMIALDEKIIRRDATVKGRNDKYGLVQTLAEHQFVANYLTREGADVNAKDDNNMTAYDHMGTIWSDAEAEIER